MLLLHDSQIDVASDTVIDILELTFVQELPILSNTFVSWLKLEAVFPYEPFEEHTYVLLVLSEELLVLS